MNQQQLNTEKLKFKIGISGLYWDKKPQYSIRINDIEVVNSFIKSSSHVVDYVEFEFDVVEDQEFILDIYLLNKTIQDTVLDSDGKILKDMILNIESIEIDGIELEYLKWSESKFYPLESERPVLVKCLNLGWNGNYRIEISSPFYLWLLEKM